MLLAVEVDGTNSKNGTLLSYMHGIPDVIASIAAGTFDDVISNRAISRYATSEAAPDVHEAERVKVCTDCTPVSPAARPTG
jgi:hypothetical protein